MRDMAFWEAGDHVLVCGDEEMINTDHGAEVHVTRRDEAGRCLVAAELQDFDIKES